MLQYLAIFKGWLFSLTITALYYSAFLNGIISLPLLVAIMIVSDDKKIMGRETNPIWVRIFGWMSIVFITCAIILAVVLYFNPLKG